jgi:hypothetical protein
VTLGLAEISLCSDGLPTEISDECLSAVTRERRLEVRCKGNRAATSIWDSKGQGERQLCRCVREKRGLREPVTPY